MPLPSSGDEVKAAMLGWGRGWVQVRTIQSILKGMAPENNEHTHTCTNESNYKKWTRYLGLAYLEYLLFSKWKSGPSFIMEI